MTGAPAGSPSGVRLRLARLAARLSQQELARAAGISRQAVAGIEAGRWDPSLRVALSLGRALGMAVEELFGPGEPPPPVEVAALAPVQPGARLDLATVGRRVVALPLAGRTTTRAGFVAAAGVLARDRPIAAAQPFGLLRPTLVVAGCDPATTLLEAQLEALDPPVGLCWWPCGTTHALALAAEGLVHAAVAHHPPGGEPEPSAGGGLGAVVGFASWREGLVLHPERAAGVDGLADIVRRRLPLVNREPGAEARALLDALLEHEGVAAGDLPGYGAEASGHLEVAAAIAAGLADVGPASEPAGLAYGLGFVPVASERAEMRIPAAVLDTAEVQALLRVLAARSLRAQLASLPGYDADLCGEVIWSA